MKKIFLLIAFISLLSISLISQSEVINATVKKVVIPVRVFEGDRFVDNLSIQDFELYEEGKLQNIEALYLVRKTQIERKETYQDFGPQVSRNFYLFFQLIEYNPKLADAIDYLFKNVITPEDTLTIMTPLKNYTLSRKAILSRLAFPTGTKKSLSQEMQDIVRKDTKKGSSKYRSLLRDLRMFVRSISGSQGFGANSFILNEIEGDDDLSSMFTPEILLPRYKRTLQELEDLRFVDEEKFIQFAEFLKQQEGQNCVFFFYQREFRPEISLNIINQLMDTYQDKPHVLQALHDLFLIYHRDVRLNVDNIKKAFADSSLLFNFIFMNKDPETILGITMREQSEDVFSTFSKVAKATGGIVDTSQNPSFAFKKAADVSESYYLLYYSPSNYKKDEEFKSVKVETKDKQYLVTHRVGYFSDRN